MASFITSPQITSNSTLFPPPPSSLLLQSTFRNLENCLHPKKRRSKRKLKPRLSLPLVRSKLQPPSSLPSSVSFDFLSLLPPAVVGFASVLAITFANQKKETSFEANSNSRVSDIGEWILFSTPTPFNRFAFLRCPSIAFDGGGKYAEDVSERLVSEEKHFVRIDSGRIHVKSGGDDVEEREDGGGVAAVEYQRVCVRTDDGGVISLDWPWNLGLSEERGLDTTVLLIPGTPDGSMDENVKCFVKDCLRQGLFPVVMNPRGCAGSPLTTARLFTAADSDDICSAVKYLTRARPWSTLTGVGWGYGANMLTKYLAEAGEKTPLTAATCIDNPFDLDEATSTSPYCSNIDDKLTGGLIDILKSNKELFHGRRKGFDVEKALAADSLRAFEKSISMVSHGFDTIEEFYSNSSSRSLVGNLKIPVLFVQNDNGTVPLFSIPRGSIAENPFTSLLLCSCLPSNMTASSWYQQLAIEWLTAVELGLLKGRHPLLQDIDVAINPSKGLALVEGRSSDTSGRHDDTVLNLTQLDSSDVYQDPMKEMLTETDALSSINLKVNQNSPRNQASDVRTSSEANGSVMNGSLKGEDSIKDMETSQEEIDRGQVLSTAQVVMNMLDVTMPGTLKEEEKKKVLSAVGKGETLIKALEDAVPEDVRGKLTTSVSEILQAQGKNLNFDSALSINRRFNGSFGLSSNNKENATLHSNSNVDKIHPSDSRALGDDRKDSSGNDQVDVDKLGEASGSDPSKKSARSDIPESKAEDSFKDDTGLSKGLNGLQNSDEELDSDAVDKKVVQLSDSDRNESEIATKMNSFNSTAGVANSEGVVMQSNSSQGDEINQKESNISVKVSEPNGTSDEQNNTRAADTRPADAGEATASPISEGQQSKNEGDSKTKNAAADTRPADANEATASSNSESQQPEKGDNIDKTAAVDTNEATAIPISESQQAEKGDSKDKRAAVDTNEAASPISESQQSEKGDIKDKREAVDTNEATASPISESQDSGKEDDSKTKGETVQPLSDQNSASDSKSPPLNVSQAFDALTGLDDSTQVAVNSVFGVIEDIIVQMEEKKNESTDNKGIENRDAINGSVIENDDSSDLHLEKQKDGEGKEDPFPLDMESFEGHDGISPIINSPTPAGGKAVESERLNLIVNKPATSNADISKDSFHMTSNPYVKALYKDFLLKYILLEMQKMNHADKDSTTTSFLDNVPGNGHWLLPKQPGGMQVAAFDNSKNIKMHPKLHPKENVMDNVIEPSYVISDKEKLEEPADELMENLNDKLLKHDDKLDRLKLFVKTTLLNSLEVEVSRRLSASDMRDMDAALAADMEGVADAVYLAIQHDGEKNQKLLFSEFDPDFQEWSRLNGNRVTEAISMAVQNTTYLKKVLPVGVIVGSTLAALRKCFDVVVVYSNSVVEASDMDKGHNIVSKSEDQSPQEKIIQLGIDGIGHVPAEEKNLKKDKESIALNAPDENAREKVRSENLNRDTLMAGAVTATLGASALLTSQQEGFMGNDSHETSEETQMKSESEDIVDNKNQSNVVTSLAEKAMSVAAPVVPTKGDGALDQDRLVTMLTELGQRGGMLSLVGKLALLWGGLRGAMSLTTRLISFLRIADRPLLHRVLGFSCMVLVLWSPVLVPLLPTLFHNMATHTSSRVVELACVVGLYAAVTILIIQWGKGIRGYEAPLKQYGLDFASSRKVQHFLTGFAGGIMLVVCIQSLNSLLGFVNFSFPSNLGSSPSNFSGIFKAYGQMLLLVGQGLLMAVGVAFVEELLFRSWLLEEIAADLGYHPGIFMSGLAFALSQRSWQSIPGLWMLSLCLAGARLKKEGSLFIPIGLRTGLMASSYILQAGGFLVYLPKYPWWITGTQPFQPFNGLVGLLFALFLAVVLYPRQVGLSKIIPRTIRA